MAGLVLKGIEKQYENGFKAVNNFNLEIKDREFIVFVGPSGCGKSTTLRMIAGLEEISGGELYIGDRVVNDVAPKDRDIAMVFQNYALYPHMTVYDNMAFALKLRKESKSEIDTKVRGAAKILDIEHLLDRKPKALSGGQRQRVAMGRAIVRKPQVFLMDEPLSNLDAKLRVQMRTEIAKLYNKLKTTFIYVTHDQTEAMTLGSRIVVMKDGVAQQIASPKEIYNNPVNLFVASFIGSPQMNIMYGKTMERENDIYLEVLGKEIKLSKEKVEKLKAAKKTNAEVLVGIRPENMSCKRNDLEKGNNIFELNIDIAENLGAETYLYLKNGDKNIVVKTATSDSIPTEGKAKFVVDEEKIHIFDKEEQMTIC
ncbi:sn-glycerol-3-phosphate ABC transporter ATP-binding protein UgpC [uncultured Clostridium sp.]|uniref:ABC transporter ATP-binding protein n=1 Tax=uncultured Clostridium sp. TaxID=59620 RepID=UPI0026294C3F|nr:sn-glycerol-3-phosphate ABC transporter ATP-binding protein UgpC [uncultured Clostridium sp.]